MSEGVPHLDSSRELALIGDARAKGEMWESRIENPCVLQGVRDGQIYLDVHQMDSIIVVVFRRHYVSDGFLTNVGNLERVADGETKLCKQEGANPAAHTQTHIHTHTFELTAETPTATIISHQKYIF